MNGKVLLAEDNVVNQDIARRLLERLDVEVDVGADGNEAIRKALGTRYDMIFMDCLMEPVDGYEAARAIRAAEAQRGSSRVPIVALTAYGWNENRKECLDAGMDDHLTKPFTRKQLSGILERWMPGGAGPVGTAAVPESESFVASPVSEEPGRLDPGVLDQIRGISGDGELLVQRVAGFYLDDTPKAVEAMREALHNGRLDDVAQSAHYLRSASGNLGAKRFVALLRAFEEAAKSGSASRCAALAPGIATEYAAVCDEIEKITGRPSRVA